MRSAWAILGLLAVAACGPAPQKTPSTTDECQNYAASRAGLGFSSVAAKQAYFNKVVTDTHGGNKSIRPTYLGCLDKIGALPDGVTSSGSSSSIPIGERTGHSSDVMSGGAGYKIVSFRANDAAFSAPLETGGGTLPVPLAYQSFSGGAALWSTMSQSEQSRLQNFLSSGGAFATVLEGKM